MSKSIKKAAKTAPARSGNPESILAREQAKARRNIAQMNALAERAAEKFVTLAFSNDEMHNKVGDEWCDLSDLAARTTCAYITDEKERKEGAQHDATFYLGLAIGRRLAGGGR